MCFERSRRLVRAPGRERLLYRHQPAPASAPRHLCGDGGYLNHDSPDAKHACEAVNTYPVWVYPPVEPVCPPCVHECRTLDDEALAVLEAGGTVYLSPDSAEEALPHSIQAQISPDFWSVGTFSKQEGGMGQLIDAEHPIFDHFPTEPHSNWQ